MMRASSILVLGILAGCAAAPPGIPLPETPPNIVWIVAEDMSPMLGCYGDATATTPRVDRLAKEGILYENAFATAPICSPSRSCLITGLYATALGTQHLRCEVDRPSFIRTFPEYLRDGGYFCTNDAKTDYNFSPAGVWDFHRRVPAPWRKRKPGQPFFSMFNIGTTHEGPTNLEDRYERAVAGMSKDLLHDPERVSVPPFYPDTPEIRHIFARLADLVTRMDQQTGEILDQLEADGLTGETIVFYFSDHGNGLPRYKRWLNDSGLRVPLIVRIPDKHRGLSAGLGVGSRTGRLVSFVDFAPTVLSLAGVPVPSTMQGIPFLGPAEGPPRSTVFGARSRADDMFECSRAVHDGRYIYVRHFMPHLPYIQPGFIYSDRKWSFRELRKLHRTGALSGPPSALWAERKPLEELYDLHADPYEIRNVASSPNHHRAKMRLRRILRDWIVEHGDTGLLQEAEYQEHGLASSPYEYVRDPRRCDLSRILVAAERVGDPSVPVADLARDLTDSERGVRYWAATALVARGEDAAPAESTLVRALGDSSASVRVAAAEALCGIGKTAEAIPALGRLIDDERPWLALLAARTLVMVGTDAKPLVPVMRKVIAKNRSAPGSRRPWKDFNYAAFTTWALEAALENCGENP